MGAGVEPYGFRKLSTLFSGRVLSRYGRYDTDTLRLDTEIRYDTGFFRTRIFVSTVLLNAESGAFTSSCLLWANSRYCALFDQLVGAAEQRHAKKCLCGLEVDGQLEICGLETGEHTDAQRAAAVVSYLNGSPTYIVHCRC